VEATTVSSTKTIINCSDCRDDFILNLNSDFYGLLVHCTSNNETIFHDECQCINLIYIIVRTKES